MSKERILVVEDAADILNMLNIYLSTQGYEVMPAMRGQIALDIARKTPPHLALLDVNLPDMEGYDIGKALRQNARTRHIPIIFLTARGEKQDRIRGLGEVQADHYFVKPFDLEEVATVVQTSLARAKQRSLTHPVTGLPTAELINDQYRALLSAPNWALGHIQINGFESFTKAYGAVAGEATLKFTALLIAEIIGDLGRTEDFAGQQIVGPAFVITSAPDQIRAIVQRIAERFDDEISAHYDYQDRRNGYITVTDEDGSERKAPLMSLSIGVIASGDGPFYDLRELTESVEETRQRALSGARDQKNKSAVAFGRV